DGYEATRAIRQHEALSGTHVPIIAMTANAMESDRDQCLAAGMDDFISKPVEPDELATAFRKWSQHAADKPSSPESRGLCGDSLPAPELPEIVGSKPATDNLSGPSLTLAGIRGYNGASTSSRDGSSTAHRRPRMDQ